MTRQQAKGLGKVLPNKQFSGISRKEKARKRAIVPALALFVIQPPCLSIQRNPVISRSQIVNILCCYCTFPFSIYHAIIKILVGEFF